jgi:hypothetical protein
MGDIMEKQKLIKEIEDNVTVIRANLDIINKHCNCTPYQMIKLIEAEAELIRFAKK